MARTRDPIYGEQMNISHTISFEPSTTKEILISRLNDAAIWSFAPLSRRYLYPGDGMDGCDSISDKVRIEELKVLRRRHEKILTEFVDSK